MKITKDISVEEVNRFIAAGKVTNALYWPNGGNMWISDGHNIGQQPVVTPAKYLILWLDSTIVSLWGDVAENLLASGILAENGIQVVVQRNKFDF